MTFSDAGFLGALRVKSVEVGENDCRNSFMVDLKENYLAELGFRLATPESAAQHTIKCATFVCVQVLQPSQPSHVEPGQFTTLLLGRHSPLSS